MLWIKAFHVIFMVTWFAALFYLPRLFVYHAEVKDEASNARFKIMERKLYFGIMTPSAILTIIFGAWLLSIGWQVYMIGYWMSIKLALVTLLVIYHYYCGRYVRLFKEDRNPHSHVWFRWFNEAPVLALVAVVILVIVKPI
jgi:protoporphyrinogen IX oxidase